MVDDDDDMNEPSGRRSLPRVPFQVGVLDYLSARDVRNLRLVCKDLAATIGPELFRSVVVPLNDRTFGWNGVRSTEEIDLCDSMFTRYGSEISRFAISYRVDVEGLALAQDKQLWSTVERPWGAYMWPVRSYPLYSELRKIDDLINDERRPLTSALSNLKNCTELAIELDTGHGWLEGPDASDLQILKANKCRVFGRRFQGNDVNQSRDIESAFTAAQTRSNTERVGAGDGVLGYNSFRQSATQTSGGDIHTGELGPIDRDQTQVQSRQATLPQIVSLTNGLRDNMVPTIPIVTEDGNAPMPDDPTVSRVSPTLARPLVFNGYDIARPHTFQHGGLGMKSKPYLSPGILREGQAQWLMETMWISQAILTTFMDSVQINSASTFTNVNSLHLPNISSGLLPSLCQDKFWNALTGLRRVVCLVKPDWRQQHVLGDQSHDTNMSIEPCVATFNLATLLRDHISRMEKLSTLVAGYSAGGEHQTGYFGRNQHVLPAPIITENISQWLMAPKQQPSTDGLFVFPHIRALTFQNCYFTPSMLTTFMEKSQDTSLHSLTLDSVSLTTGTNSTQPNPLETNQHHLKCQHAEVGWLNESVPAYYSWVKVLDAVTPGRTILDRKYAANMIDTLEHPQPTRGFRGNIQRLNLKSCGYVAIAWLRAEVLNQNDLVMQPSSVYHCQNAGGLAYRAKSFETTLSASRFGPGEASKFITSSSDEESDYRPENLAALPRDNWPFPVRTDSRNNGRITRTHTSSNGPYDGSLTLRPLLRHVMMCPHARQPECYVDGMARPKGMLPQYLGYLTQCIHPIEKRVLEQMWGMKFGWGDSMDRWDAVEDGWLEGGTGRFSGTISRDDDSGL